jgi:hypothetical protein
MIAFDKDILITTLKSRYKGPHSLNEWTCNLSFSHLPKFTWLRSTEARMRAAVLSMGNFSPRGLWQCVDMFFIVIADMLRLVTSG